MQRLAMLLTVLVVSVLAPSAVQAQTLCRCAFPSLEARICQNNLTAKVSVRGGYTDAQTGNRVYRANVQQTFRGQSPARAITIEVPRDCGRDLRSYTSYAVSLNRNPNGSYSTFACSSWLKPWREVTRAELARLRDPACPPSCDDIACEQGESCELVPVQCVRAPCPPQPTCLPETAACFDYSGMSFGSCEKQFGWAVQDGECRAISGCRADVPFYRSPEECAAACAVAQDGVCYRFSETDPDAFVNRPCEAELKCTATSNRIGFNSERFCKPETFCIDESSAAADCASLPHIAVPGRWGCNANTCVWRVGP